MSVRDMIVGTVVTAALLAVVIWVAISIYHHEFESQYGQTATSVSYAAAQMESVGLM
jgi:hypothetical protein